MPERFVIGRGFESEGKKNDSTRGSYNTMRPDPATRPTRTFRSRITVFFALAAVMTAVLLSAVLAYVWEGQFQGYTRQNMQRTAQAAADTLGAQYQTGGGWTDEVIAYADTFATGNPEIGLQILNSQGRSSTTASRPRSGGGPTAPTTRTPSPSSRPRSTTPWAPSWAPCACGRRAPRPS